MLVLNTPPARSCFMRVRSRRDDMAATSPIRSEFTDADASRRSKHQGHSEQAIDQDRASPRDLLSR